MIKFIGTKISVAIVVMMFSFLVAYVADNQIRSSEASTAQTKNILVKSQPGVTHDEIPHGVPQGYDWRRVATVKRLEPPTDTMTYINLRGAVYVSERNTHPSNTRVQIADCSAYGLDKASSTWQRLFNFPGTSISGKAWKEDFSSPGTQQQTDIKTDWDDYISVTATPGYSLHFYQKLQTVPLVYAGSKYKHFTTACSARLILADPAKPDDRNQSSYLMTVGHDWKTKDNGCVKNSSGSTLCYTMGTGRFVILNKAWKRVVNTTLTANDINTLPLPPYEMFKNPNGTYGEVQPSSSETSTNTNTNGGSTDPQQVNTTASPEAAAGNRPSSNKNVELGAPGTPQESRRSSQSGNPQVISQNDVTVANHDIAHAARAWPPRLVWQHDVGTIENITNNRKPLVTGAVIAAGLVAGGYGVYRLRSRMS